MLRSPFLPDFPKFLFGSTKKKESEVLAARLESLRSGGLSELSAVIGRFLRLGELFGKPTSGRGSRNRVFSTQVTFWAFLHQVLTRNMACRDAVRKRGQRAEKEEKGSEEEKGSGRKTCRKPQLRSTPFLPLSDLLNNVLRDTPQKANS